MTIDEIKKMLDDGLLTPSKEDVVKDGVLLAHDGSSVKYQLHHGWDIAKAHICDKEWGKFNVELVRFIKTQNYDNESLATVLEQIQMDDAHWNWFDKSIYYKATEFDWFFLMANNSLQGACLIYHPKPSALEKGDIFYIEYIAVAPWNRVNPMQTQVFRGVGSIIIKYAVNYAHTVLNLKHGFSLHALPKASSFYYKIGMTDYPSLDKEGLQYFEMPGQSATKFVGT
jgi:hypothetical protein